MTKHGETSVSQRCDGCGKAPFSIPKNAADQDPQQGNDQMLQLPVEVPLKACTRCQQAYYHNIDCQKQHYPMHKHVCRKQGRAVSVDDNKRRAGGDHAAVVAVVQQTRQQGRSWVALQDIQVGETLWFDKNAQSAVSNNNNNNKEKIGGIKRARPIVPPVLSENTRSTHCAVCFRLCQNTQSTSTDPLTKKSYAIQTCSDLCQQVALETGIVAEEQTVQRVLKQGRIPKILPTALLVYRVLVASRMNDSQTSKTETTSRLPQTSWTQILDMVPQQEDTGGTFSNDDALVHEQAICMTVIAMLQMAPNLEHSAFSQQELIIQIRQVLSRTKANAFSITSKSESKSDHSIDCVLGIALFESPAYLLNHSCQPNATQTFLLTVRGEFPQLSFVANRPIVAGKEITISYMDYLPAKSHQRREQIQHAYHFVCQCSYCLNGLDISL
mmetsp:Transcript_3057/g.4121  ORF Transcript_3057/g.4121 Transcript_3057/m.4121 type:complete len:441 (+) Transcript_3057:90-1412(+)|eukprot:CAMPEP_0198149492 /NCGR_PEP_ID=MMETSP1443-20131203/46866_1 /TAXON_ID=186043 /ORGANISM="Entomoneis sp., Strain CCMP2396" /LENGTH=440 /DNA_ID=CAMNT_0043814551 /DNA_START=3 /DNA_END=1325 /DNA_ORIENTATION=-